MVDSRVSWNSQYRNEITFSGIGDRQKGISRKDGTDSKNFVTPALREVKAWRSHLVFSAFWEGWKHNISPVGKKSC
jgi:hypothetical protein